MPTRLSAALVFTLLACGGPPADRCRSQADCLGIEVCVHAVCVLPTPDAGTDAGPPLLDLARWLPPLIEGGSSCPAAGCNAPDAGALTDPALAIPGTDAGAPPTGAPDAGVTVFDPALGRWTHRAPGRRPQPPHKRNSPRQVDQWA